ncbi:GntR family transcriptional regulator [Orrella sp. JC864]|uniref:GntR family transcriptional regulator n=1 Tax=Orrella sp. JC864 TaxID=3120298 RepID=UPI0012BB6BA0
MSAPIVQQALYQEVASRLRHMIRVRQLTAGAWIDEARLTQQLGISRTPLREALKVLATEGLVRLEPRRGCFVSELSWRDIEDIFPLIANLEGLCAHEAARKIREQDIAPLEALHAQLRTHAEAGRIDAYYDTNYRIHAAIQELADNRWLSDSVDRLRKVIGLSRYQSLTVPGRVARSCAEHLAIFQALKDRDPARAEACAREHLMNQLLALREAAQAEAQAGPQGAGAPAIH